MGFKFYSFFVSSFLIFVISQGCSQDKTSTHNLTAPVIEKLSSLNALREGLAASIDPNQPITPDTFKTTCMPVGMEYKRWSESHGFTSKQVSDKNRNPLHSPNATEEKIITEFQNQKTLQHKVATTTEGTFVYHRINVTSACLHCHGSKDTRPDFIKSKYPEDKAYDYKEGDFRGIYSVFIPKVLPKIQN